MSSIDSKKLLEWTKGVREDYLPIAIKMTQRALSTLLGETAISSAFTDLEKLNHEFPSQNFLAAVYASCICKELRYNSQPTVDKVLMGTLTKDTGLLQIAEDIVMMNREEMSGDDFQLYKVYPKKSAEFMSRVSLGNEGIRQIVMQHREYLDGTGFPSNINGQRVYPLARIVCLSTDVSNAIINTNQKPIDAIKALIGSKELIKRYDQDFIKALIKCFIANKG